MKSTPVLNRIDLTFSFRKEKLLIICLEIQKIPRFIFLILFVKRNFTFKKMKQQLWVLIHGIGAYSYCFEWLVSHLNTNSSIAKDVLVLTFDLYGRGFSEYATPQTQGLFVNQTKDLLQTLNLVDFSSCAATVKSPIKSPRTSPVSPREKSSLPIAPIPTFSFPPFKTFTLVGHSMGGAISLCFCHTYPEIVESMILLSPAGG